jgi:hypothetical protein
MERRLDPRAGANRAEQVDENRDPLRRVLRR